MLHAFCQQKLEAAGKLTHIEVDQTHGDVRFTGKFTTKNNGVSIECWDDPGLDEEVDSLIQEYWHVRAVRD